MTIRYCRRGITLYPGDRCQCCSTHYSDAYTSKALIPQHPTPVIVERPVYATEPVIEVEPDGDVEIRLGGGLEYNVTDGRYEVDLGGGFEVEL